MIIDEDPTSPDPDGDDIEDADPEEQGQEAVLESDGDEDMETLPAMSDHSFRTR